jgi:DNA-binding phage protein
MALTRDFKETIAARVQKDARFRRAMLAEAVETLLRGDLDAGKAMLRDYINATIGFETLAREIGKDSKSIHRMLGPRGNPTAENIFSIVRILQKVGDLSFQVKVNQNKAA